MPGDLKYFKKRKVETNSILMMMMMMAVFRSFWRAISESEPGWTSRKKVPNGVRLKSTRQSHSRSFPHTSARVPEFKKTSTGGVPSSCVFVTSSAVGRACHSAWRARSRGACAAGGLFDLPRCAAPCVRPSGNYCRLRWPGGRAGRAKLNCGTQKFLQFFWCQATEQQNNTT